MSTTRLAEGRSRRHVSSLRARRLRPLAAVGAVSALLLTGCAGVNPGVAADVDGTRISMSTVDETSTDFCTAIKPQLGTGTNPNLVSMGQLRGYVVRQLIIRAVSDRVAEDYGVSAGSDYRTALRSAEIQASTLAEDKRPAFAELQTSGLYANDILSQAAKADLAASGSTDPSDEEISAATNALVEQYLTDLDIVVDPRFGVAGDLSAADTGISFAVSDLAKLGAKAAEDDASYANALPRSLRCQK